MKTALAFPDDDDSNKSRDVTELIKEFQNKLDRFNDSVIPFNQITDLHQWLDHRRATRTCGVLAGGSGIGKTRACKLYTHLANKSMKQSTNDPSSPPVVYVRAHSEFSPKAFFASIVEAHNLKASSDKLTHVQHRAISSLKAAKTQLIILDQAELLSRQSARFIYDLIEQTKVPVVLSGGNRFEQLVKANDFLNKHFFCYYSFFPLTPKELEHFIQAWEYEFEVIELFQDSNVRLLQKASEGSLRKLVQILTALTFLAIQEKVSTIDEPILKKVLRQFI